MKDVRAKIRVAVLSGSMLPGHSVFRNFRQCVEALTQSDEFEVVLVVLDDLSTVDLPEVATDDEETKRNKQALKNFRSLFDKVVRMGWESHTQLASAASWIALENFDLVYYPDVGMTAQSLLLANKRLAPVQVSNAPFSLSGEYFFYEYLSRLPPTGTRPAPLGP